MDRRFNAGGIILSVIAFLLVVVFVFMLYNDSKLQNLLYNQTSPNPDSNQIEYEQTITESAQKVQSAINESFSSIVIYGDEYAGNGTLSDELSDKIQGQFFKKINDEIRRYPRIIGQYLEIPVSNVEVHDENFDTILTRIGIETVFVARDCVISADSEEGSEILLKTISGNPLQLSIQSYTSLGTVTINGIEGKLSRSHSEETGAYIFKRDSDGEEVKIVSGTQVKFSVSEEYRESVPVIIFGNNNSYSNLNKFIKSCQKIIQHQVVNDKYIIICRTPANSDVDNTMTETFGHNYIRTGETIDYNDLAEKIVFRMKTLKYLDTVSESVEKAEKNIFPDD